MSPPERGPELGPAPVDDQPPTAPPAVAGLIDALRDLRGTIAGARYTLHLPTAQAAQRAGHTMVDQLDDYLVPRLQRLDAPLLVVVGGSTGAGKSTLVNSLVRASVSPAGVLRPTTRAPALVCHPTDAPWFTEAHILPGLARTAGSNSDPSTLQVVSAPALTPGLALLDAPDIDSVVDANRALAAQLLAAADLWLFVTTAARYADAVPWDLLHSARDRGAAVALVLDRVPPGADAEVGAHLSQMLRDQGLGEALLFVLPETTLDGQGLLDEARISPLRTWLTGLASDAAARAQVVRQTVDGALSAIRPTVEQLAVAAEDQVNASDALAQSVHASYANAQATVEHGVRDGTLLRGEVLARWQELVGTGDLMRSLQARVGRLRDRLAATFTGRPPTGGQFQAALESGVLALIRSAAADAAEQAATAWRAHPAGAALIAQPHAGAAAPASASSGAPRHADLGTASAELTERAERTIRDWQRAVLELVRTEAGGRLQFARASAYAVNGAGLIVMVAVFTATSFIPTGLEVAAAGGTTVAAQKVLEAIFGDQAVRALAAQARADLLSRVQELLDGEAQRYLAVLAAAGVDPDTASRLRAAASQVDRERAGVDLGPAPAAASTSGEPAAGRADHQPGRPDSPTRRFSEWLRRLSGQPADRPGPADRDDVRGTG